MQAFHPTLPLIVSGADDRQVKLWRMNGECTKRCLHHCLLEIDSTLSCVASQLLRCRVPHQLQNLDSQLTRQRLSCCRHKGVGGGHAAGHVNNVSCVMFHARSVRLSSL